MPGKYGGLGLRSGKLVAGAQHVMSLQKCANDMATHTDGWDLRECVKEAAESWLKNCIGMEFDVDKWLSEAENEQSEQRASYHSTQSYSMSLAQQC